MFKFQIAGFGFSGLDFQVWGLGFGFRGFELRFAEGKGFEVSGLEFRVSGFRAETSAQCVSGFGLEVLGLEFRVSGDEVEPQGSYLRLIDFVYHSTLGLRVIKKKKTSARAARAATRSSATCSSSLLGPRSCPHNPVLHSRASDGQ